jgi:hypothetical protein
MGGVYILKFCQKWSKLGILLQKDANEIETKKKIKKIYNAPVLPHPLSFSFIRVCCTSILHCKKRFAVFPSPPGVTLTKLFLAGNGKSDNLFLQCTYVLHTPAILTSAVLLTIQS